jgi:antitoxin StbD
MEVFKQVDCFSVTVLNRNKPEFYCFSADACADLLHKLVDIELAQIVKPRIGQEEVEVSLDNL